ncbi:MAG: CoA-binding protein [Pseudorhodobacter sp.]
MPGDDVLRDILSSARVVAMVGASLNPLRASYFVARYLSMRGLRVIPVNPGHAGKILFGEKVMARLSDIPADLRVDMLDIFRRPEHVLPVVEEGLAHLPHLRTVWMQIGVTHAGAATLAEAQGMRVVQDRCPKLEYQRLFGELRQGGFNTGVISSRL